MNKLSAERRTAVIHSPVEGNSIRATCRLTGTAKGTVLQLLAKIGEACWRLHDATVRNLKTKRVQCDEIWSFVGCKQRNVDLGKKGVGDVWTWVALDAETKLAVSWCVGDRSPETGLRFMRDVAARLANRVQLTTDGHSVYLTAVEAAFGLERRGLLHANQTVRIRARGWFPVQPTSLHRDNRQSGYGKRR